MCIWYLATLVLMFFCVDPSEFSIFKIMLSVNGGSFASSASMWMPFISYLFPISFYSMTLARTSSAMSNSSGENGHSQPWSKEVVGEAESPCS